MKLLATPTRLKVLHLLIILFGITAWLGVNSTFVQLPLLVEAAPEGWSLPSYIVIIIQCGNLGPLLYTALQRCRPFKDAPLIMALLVTGCVGAVLFALFYDQTAMVFGEERSVAILAVAFLFALVGCTSSVLFMPYMGRFKEVYLVTYLIGEGLSGFVPSTVALIQGVGGNTECLPSNSSTSGFEPYTPPPRFGVQAFYYFIFSLFVASTIAFIFLDLYPSFKSEYAAREIKHGNDYSYKHEEETTPKSLSRLNYIGLLVLLGFVCSLINGVVPSVQSYSCLPYGNVAYHLAVTLSAIANPTACFLAFFVPHKSIRLVTWLTAISLLFAGYAFATSLISPPPLQGKWVGDFLVVLCWTLLTGLHSFIRLAITSIFRQQGGKSLVWVGSVTQIGSFVGSAVAFVLVNFTALFTQYDPCAAVPAS